MNILVVTDYYPPDRIGGVGTLARGLVDAYTALGHRVHVLTTGEARADERAAGIHRSARRLMWGVLKNQVLALRLIARHDIDVVHLHQAGSTLFLLARRMFDTFPRVVTSLQVSYVGEAREVRAVSVAGRRFVPRIGEYVEKLLLAPAHILVDLVGYLGADVVTVVSRDNRDELLATYGRLQPREVHVVPNGVAASPAASVPLDPWIEGRLTGRIVIGYAGVFRARKRVGNLLLAFADVARRNPDPVLLLAGGGRGYDGALRALARELGIEERVVFAGPLAAGAVARVLELSDMFCLLSSYEGMPMAVLEAMQAGKAIIATDRWGQRELLAEGAGLLVPVDDVPATAAALESLVRNPALRRRLGDAARARAAARYRWDDVAREYLRLVESA